jgi:hypothetical protein
LPKAISDHCVAADSTSREDGRHSACHPRRCCRTDRALRESVAVRASPGARAVVLASQQSASNASYMKVAQKLRGKAREGVFTAQLAPTQGKLSRNSNQIARGRIRWFESCMPSQTVALRAPEHCGAALASTSARVSRWRSHPAIDPFMCGGNCVIPRAASLRDRKLRFGRKRDQQRPLIPTEASPDVKADSFVGHG